AAKVCAAAADDKWKGTKWPRGGMSARAGVSGAHMFGAMPHAESPGRQWLRLWTWGFAAYPVLGVMAAIQDEVNAVNAGRPAHWLALFVTNYAYHFSYILFVPPLFLLVRRFPLDRAHWKGSAPVLLAVTLGLVVVKIAIIEPLEAQVFALGATFGSHVMGSMYDVWAGDAELKALLARSEEHTSELQSRENLVCRLLLEKK